MNERDCKLPMMIYLSTQNTMASHLCR